MPPFSTTHTLLECFLRRSFSSPPFAFMFLIFFSQPTSGRDGGRQLAQDDASLPVTSTLWSPSWFTGMRFHFRTPLRSCLAGPQPDVVVHVVSQWTTPRSVLPLALAGSVSPSPPLPRRGCLLVMPIHVRSGVPLPYLRRAESVRQGPEN